MSLPAEELLTELAARGVEVLAREGTLRLRPAAAVPAELVPEIREQKCSLLELLRSPGRELEARIVASLSAGPMGSLALSLRLGRPRDEEFYEALARLLDRREIATDGRSCAFWRVETART